MDATMIATVVMFLLGVILTASAYLLVPMIVILRGKKYNESTIKKITIINGIVWFLIFTIGKLATGNGIANPISCAVWSSIAYWMLSNFNRDRKNRLFKILVLSSAYLLLVYSLFVNALLCMENSKLQDTVEEQKLEIKSMTTELNDILDENDQVYFEDDPDAFAEEYLRLREQRIEEQNK